MKILSYCLMLFFAIVMVACTGTDTETIVKETQCHDGTTVTGDEICPEPPSQGTTPSQESPEREAENEQAENKGACDFNVTGSTPFDGSGTDDVICGDAGVNNINAGKGDDIVYGKGGDDVLKGENGNDTLHGEDGNDTLNGGEDHDTLNGGAGDDTFIAGGPDGEGDDIFNGGPGSSDTVDYSGATTSLTIDLSAGFSNDEHADTDTYKDIENVIGGAAADTLTGDSGSNQLDGGNDEVADTLNGGEGKDFFIDRENDIFNGGSGDDTVIAKTSANLTIGGDRFNSIENLRGNEEANILTGNDGPNKLEGMDGNDELVGGDGRDTLMGGPGDDCFNIPVPTVTADAITEDEKASIRDTKDTITDFKDGEDKINLGTHTLYTASNADTAPNAVVGNVEIRSGNVDVILEVSDEVLAVDEDLDATPQVRAKPRIPAKPKAWERLVSSGKIKAVQANCD